MFATLYSGDDLRAASILPERSTRERDPERESVLLDALLGRINAAPDQALQSLVQTVVDLCGAGSAGVSMLQGNRFVWSAIAGAWAQYVDQGLPYDASPCGVVIDQNAALLFNHPKRIFPNIEAEPEIVEILLVPILVDGEPRGTLWAISHDDTRFDAEDARVLERMSLMAAAIQEAKQSHDGEQRRAVTAADRVRSTLAMMRTLVRRGDEDAEGAEAAALSKLSSRLGAYAAGAIGRGPDRTVELWSLIAHLLAQHGERPGERVTLTGDGVHLVPTQAGPLALAIHELLENAYSHGALANPNGSVTIDWDVERISGPEQLRLVWQESGRRAALLGLGQGFGIELLQEGLPALIEATTSISFEPRGLRFELKLSLPPQTNSH